MESGERSESYYNILGVTADSSIDEIRRAYRKLAMQWHPDKWAAANPSLHFEAKRKFQKIQEAYSVLSNPGKRSTYDIGMYDPNDEEDEGFCDFVEEMLNLMSQVKEEEKTCSLGDLQNMFNELAQSFTPPADWDAGPVPSVSHPAAAFQGRLRWETNPIQSHANRMPGSGFGISGINSFCR